MIIAVHQGHFLPWLGYWNKVANADIFVWLDTVQFRKNYFQNRVEIKTIKGEKAWLTVPVTYHFGERISSVRIAGAEWKRKVVATIRQNYMKAHFYAQYHEILFRIMEEAGGGLDDLNYALFRHIKDVLEMDRVKVEKASMLSLSDDDSTQRLVEICRRFGATHYIAGKGGANYMDIRLFEKEGIKIIWQEFHVNHPVYPQIKGDFVPGLSVIDSLFNVGAEETIALVRKAWHV